MPEPSNAPEARRPDTPGSVPSPKGVATSNDTDNSQQSAHQQAFVTHTAAMRAQGAKHVVRIVPPLVGEDLDQVFATFQAARDYALGLRASRGFLIDAGDRVLS